MTGIVDFRTELLDETGAPIDDANPLPVSSSGGAVDLTNHLLEMAMRLLKTLESNATVDSAQRQRITLDTITAGVALPTVTTVTTVSSVTNMASNAGMDREQYINIARNTYANAIRPQLTFV